MEGCDFGGVGCGFNLEWRLAGALTRLGWRQAAGADSVLASRRGTCKPHASGRAWYVAVVVKTVLGSHFGVGAPPILVVFLVGKGMFTGGTGF